MVILFLFGFICIWRCCFEDEVFLNNDDYDEFEKEVFGCLFCERLYIVVEEDMKKRINDVF